MITSSITACAPSNKSADPPPHHGSSTSNGLGEKAGFSVPVPEGWPSRFALLKCRRTESPPATRRGAAAAHRAWRPALPVRPSRKRGSRGVVGRADPRARWCRFCGRRARLHARYPARHAGRISGALSAMRRVSGVADKPCADAGDFREQGERVDDHAIANDALSRAPSGGQQ